MHCVASVHIVLFDVLFLVVHWMSLENYKLQKKEKKIPDAYFHRLLLRTHSEL